MLRWESEFLNHPIHGLLQQIDDGISQDVESSSLDAISEKNRLRKVINLVKSVISKLDPDVAPLDILRQLHEFLSSRNIVGVINQYIADGNVDHLRNVNNFFSEALPLVYQLSSLKFSRSTRRADIDASTKTFDEFKGKIHNYLDNVNDKTNNLFSEIDNFRESVSYVQSEIERIKISLSDKISEYNKEVESSIEEYKARMDDYLSDSKENFYKKFDELIDSFRQKWSEIYDEQSNRIDSMIQESSSKLGVIVSDSQDKYKKILEFYGLVAQNSVTGGYKKDAEDEEWQADFWRWATIICIVLTAIWIIVAILCLEPDVSDIRLYWADIAKGVSLTTLLVSSAVYTSRQSSIHRYNARRARYFFLQVKAFDPFIASLPEDRRADLKEKMSARIFKGDIDIPVEEKDCNFGISNAEKAVSLIERISRAISK